MPSPSAARLSSPSRTAAEPTESEGAPLLIGGDAGPFAEPATETGASLSVLPEATASGKPAPGPASPPSQPLRSKAIYVLLISSISLSSAFFALMGGSLIALACVPGGNWYGAWLTGRLLECNAYCALALLSSGFALRRQRLRLPPWQLAHLLSDPFLAARLIPAATAVASSTSSILVRSWCHAPYGQPERGTWECERVRPVLVALTAAAGWAGVAAGGTQVLLFLARLASTFRVAKPRGGGFELHVPQGAFTLDFRVARAGRSGGAAEAEVETRGMEEERVAPVAPVAPAPADVEVEVEAEAETEAETEAE